MRHLLLPVSIISAVLFMHSPVYAAPGHHDHHHKGDVSQQSPSAEAAISDKIVNYQRQSPTLATSGALKPGAISALKQGGFKTIIDLRTPKEGVAQEQAEAVASGLQYHNLPVAGAFPDAALREQFKQLLEDPANYPVLVHCASANRVGMVWAAYQLDQGVDFETAAAEGRAIGMKVSKEQQLNDYYQSLAKPATETADE